MVPENHTVKDLSQKSMKANGWGVLRILKSPSIHPSYSSQLFGEVGPVKCKKLFKAFVDIVKYDILLFQYMFLQDCTHL